MRLNADFSQRVVLRPEDRDWVASPMAGVDRQMLDRIGEEVARATSIVRYAPESYFSEHTHGGGEEFFVLEGVFSDEHGDWPAGTYLLNPEGFRHTPYSKPGCTLLVKLRQFPGLDREHHVIDTEALEWQAGEQPRVSRKPLYAQEGFGDRMALERWDAGAEPGTQRDPGGIEYFVISGAFEDESGWYPAGTWLRLPAGVEHTPRSGGGCTLYVKRGGFAYLRGAD